MPAVKYIETDDGGPGWAAWALVALAFVYGDIDAPNDHIFDLAGRLHPKGKHRLLALEVLRKIADPANSELAGLWHEGGDDAQFDAAIEHLRSPLQAASQDLRELPKPKTGDAIALETLSKSTELVTVRVVGSGVAAIFKGTCADEKRRLSS